MARDVSDDTTQTIGEMLRHLRQEKLWSQAELAHRIGSTSVSVGRWEKNVTRPNLHFQQQLCEIFAKSPEDLGFVPQAEPEHREDSALAPVSFPPLLRRLMSGHGMARQRRRLFVGLICLSLFLLFGTLFWFARSQTLFSSAHLPSCQIPSSHESAAKIYAQVMCRHAQFSSTLDRQDELQWDENNQCRFQQGAYHVLLPATMYVAECFAHVAPFGPNFALQADITILKGYSGGLVFRAEGPSSNWDVITSRVPIDIWGQYNFDLANTNVACHRSKDPIDPTYCYSPHGTITYGTGATNAVTVIVLDSLVYLYVNGFFIDQGHAPASSPLTGYLGVFANGSRTTGEVAFSHLQIWNI